MRELANEERSSESEEEKMMRVATRAAKLILDMRKVEEKSQAQEDIWCVRGWAPRTTGPWQPNSSYHTSTAHITTT